MTNPDPSAGLTFKAVDASLWPDLERLFEGRGGPRNCWCMVWRATPEERRAATAAQGKAVRGKPAPSGLLRKAALKRRVDAGVPIGLLAYNDSGEPVGWVSVAPRRTYRPMGGPAVPDDDPGRIWSIVCFFLQRRLRGQGILYRLLEAAVEHARRRGAAAVEAYPVAADASSYRFMGFVPAFEKAGFRPIGPAGTIRTLMRLDLS